VHLTLLESIPLIYELLIDPLPDGDLDRYCAEAAVMEPLLDIPDGTLPRRWSDVAPAIAGVVNRQHIGEMHATRALGRHVLYPSGSALIWPAIRPVRLLTIGLLPPIFREIYGFSWTPHDARALDRWTRAIRAVRRRTPAFAREWPAARRSRDRLCSSAANEPISLG
jgi:uncharacterized protein (DUF2236 family)